MIVLIKCAVPLLVLCLPLASCSMNSDPIPEENRIVRADRWYLGDHEVPRCGDRINAESIQMFDVEELDYDAEKLQQEIGPFIQVTERPVAVSGKGSQDQVRQRVKETAAGKGCDVVLLGPVQSQAQFSGGDGIRGGGGARKSEVSYQLFRMGYRTE